MDSPSGFGACSTASMIRNRTGLAMLSLKFTESLATEHVGVPKAPCSGRDVGKVILKVLGSIWA